MKKKEEYTKEVVEMYLRATSEKKIYANDLLEEMWPLSEECFVAELELTKDNIVWNMTNGQKF